MALQKKITPDEARRLMDGDHGELASLIDDVREAIGCQDTNRVREHLLVLYERERRHFLCEEEIMQHFGYSATQDHRNAHRSLLDTVEQLYRLLVLEDLQQLDARLASYLDRTLQHMRHADTPLHAYLGELGDAKGD